MGASLFGYRGQVIVGLLADTAVPADPRSVAERVLASEIGALGQAERARDRAALRGRRAA